jgi:hypothetical protein
LVLTVALWVWQSRVENVAAFDPPRAPVIAAQPTAGVLPDELPQPVPPPPAPTATAEAIAPAPPATAAVALVEDPPSQAPTVDPKNGSSEAKTAAKWGVVEFRVLPASTLIMVDGRKRHATSGGDHYVLQLKPGKHTIVARDPDGSEPTQQAEVEVTPGDYQKLKGFSFLP